ncbi:hypothetical protein TIFTF001_008618 [Ficus carica]|uniref:IQ domain-containing protein IQM3-like n=1 Tax=Ficus carica TaxID=3494 RepID=A0AA88A8Y2_FICCA|nr:hypothetical protein TIFTF001_008618 [Ficus carica]
MSCSEPLMMVGSKGDGFEMHGAFNEKFRGIDGGDVVGDVDMTGELAAEKNAAVKVQKVFRGHRERRMLADSAVEGEELWSQALDFAALNRTTISYFNSSKPESPTLRWNRVCSNACKVGKGLSLDENAQKLVFQQWIEAIDPRHRYGWNLQAYYEEWCKTDAGQPFFYWLDIGDGKDLDLEKCPRSKLREQCVKYLGPKQRGKFHHSSFLAGGATIAAGTLGAENGILKSISPYTGHYQTTSDRLHSFLSFFMDNGVNLDQVEGEFSEVV